MALWSVNNLQNATPAQTNLTTTFKTVLSLAAATATLRRAFIYEYDFGADGVPNATDCAIAWDISAQTAAGTPVVMTCVALDQADVPAGSGSVAGGNHSAEPTITATSSRFAFGANQRASYRWQVNPGGPGELVVPATNLAGYALRAKSTNYASTALATFFFRE